MSEHNETQEQQLQVKLERIGCSLARAAARDTLQLAQHRQVGVACRGSKVHVRQVGDGHKADMRILAVEGAPGQRLVDILKPMGADKIDFVGDGAKITGVMRDRPRPGRQPRVDAVTSRRFKQRIVAPESG